MLAIHTASIVLPASSAEAEAFEPMRAHVVVYGATPAGIVAAALAARAETPVQAVGYEDLRAALAKQGQRVLKAPPPQP